MIRVWPVLLALAVWLPLAADETAPAPDAVWINQFDDPGVLEKETRLEGTRFLVPKTKFYIADEPTASDGKVLGTHEGIWRYTIGQRRGLGIGFGQRMFVCGIDPEQNTVTLTSGEGLFRSTLTAGEVNLIEVEDLTGPVRVTAKIRYAAKPAEALLTPLADGRVQVVFDEPQRAITPGQSVVFYQGRRVFGGGKIERPL